MDAFTFFSQLATSRKTDNPKGICAVCSAHPMVLRAHLENAAAMNTPALVEATANQVNQFGGYTGMLPADFYTFMQKLAKECGLPEENLILGGDHLGPFVWRDKPASEAMANATDLVRAYVLAGFQKIHLDTSMHLGDDDHAQALSNETIARRGAELCKAAEEAFAERKQQYPAAKPPVYVIGSEVPAPGGPQDTMNSLQPTRPEDFTESYNTFRTVFSEAGLEEAFSRIIAFVVQPGVEFTGDAVFGYDSQAAKELCAALDLVDKPLLFEGHSTDYQTPGALAEMVRDGIAILKVGPALTFALREGLFALEQIEHELAPGASFAPSMFGQTLEDAMLADVENWKKYYTGDEAKLRLDRRYSYLDRARYYLQQPSVNAAAEKLMQNLAGATLPPGLLCQYLPAEYEAVRTRELEGNPTELLLWHVKKWLADYNRAV